MYSSKKLPIRLFPNVPGLQLEHLASDTSGQTEPTTFQTLTFTGRLKEKVVSLRVQTTHLFEDVSPDSYGDNAAVLRRRAMKEGEPVSSEDANARDGQTQHS